jgi:hypothetical protein
MIPTESTSIDPDHVFMMDGTTLTFVVLKDGTIWDCPWACEHIVLVMERPEMAHLESSEAAAQWRDDHSSNSGYINGTDLYLWGEPDQQDYAALVTRYGSRITVMKYWVYEKPLAKVLTGD